MTAPTLPAPAPSASVRAWTYTLGGGLLLGVLTNLLGFLGTVLG
ncbi:MAG: hypothetical protein ACRDOO_04595 [Actinomadura sp.]